MKTIEKITVKGETYQLCDPAAARLDDTVVGAAAWSAKNLVDRLCPAFTETGVAVRCQPLEGYPLTVTAEAGASAVTRWGKNRLDYTQALPRNANSAVTVIDGGISWDSGSYFFFAPCAVRAGETVTFSCVDEAGAVSYAMLYDRVKKVACSAQEYPGKPMVATADADALCIYKTNPSEAIVTPIVLTRLQLETGAVATDYAPYRQPETFAPGQTIPARSGVNTLVADSGQLTVTGRADPIPLLQSLMKQ